MRHVLRFGIVTVMAGVTFIACATTGGSGSGPAPAAKGPTVVIKGFAFDPASYTVAKGTTVTFDNQDNTTHTVTSGANRTKDGKFDRQLSGGTAAPITFDTPGTYDYFCNFHDGMVAKIFVP